MRAPTPPGRILPRDEPFLARGRRCRQTARRRTRPRCGVSKLAPLGGARPPTFVRVLRQHATGYSGGVPLFHRHDGDAVRGLPAVRRIMPIVMRRRSESLVFHDSVFEIDGARRWLKRWNRAHPEHATLFHLLTYACAAALHQRPELNRFVSGGRIYQRRGVQLSFVAKRAMSDAGATATVKLEIPAG